MTSFIYLFRAEKVAMAGKRSGSFGERQVNKAFREQLGQAEVKCDFIFKNLQDIIYNIP